MAKQKFKRATTPKGIAKYPWLTKADTKFKQEGEYKVDLIVPKKDVATLIADITAVRDQFAAQEKAKKKAALPFAEETDDNGKKTGNVVLKFRVKAKTGDWDRKPKLFDVRGNRVTDVSVGGGSSIKVSFDIYPWNVASLGCGVTLQPVAVQIIDLVEFDGSGSAGDFGFGEEEGSFEGNDDVGSEMEADAESEDDDVF